MTSRPCTIVSINGTEASIPGVMHDIRIRRLSPADDLVKREIYADIDAIKAIRAGGVLVQVVVRTDDTCETFPAYTTTDGTLLEF